MCEKNTTKNKTKQNLKIIKKNYLLRPKKNLKNLPRKSMFVICNQTTGGFSIKS